MKMNVGRRVRQLRAEKGLSQRDLQELTGMLRHYISRIENGHSVPTLENLERLAAALDVPLYQLFYVSDDPPSIPSPIPRAALEQFGQDPCQDGKGAPFLMKLKMYTNKIAEPDRKVLLDLARKLAPRRGPPVG